MTDSIAKSTMKSYNSALKAYERFMQLNNVSWTYKPPISECSLLSFVTYCFNSLNLSYSTIKLYLAGLRFHYICAGVANPFEVPSANGAMLPRLQMVLRGIKKNDKPRSKVRLPITIELLHSICSRLSQGLFNSFLDQMLITACVTAFFGFLRCGEFTCNPNFDPQVNLSLNNIQFRQDHAVITLQQSKTDPFRQGVPIKLFCLKSDLCPMCHLAYYLRLRCFLTTSYHGCSSSLFINSKGQALTRTEFLNSLNSILRAVGLDPCLYSGHSFRIGAATTASSARLEDHLIKTLGRWSSDAYCRYIKTPAHTLLEAQAALTLTNN
jgi:hypothetical protein